MTRLGLLAVLAAAAVLVVSCTDPAPRSSDPPAPPTAPAVSGPDEGSVEEASGPAASASAASAVAASSVPASSTAAFGADTEPEPGELPVAAAEAVDNPGAADAPDPREEMDPLVRQATEPWPTDWRNRTIDLGELLLGLPMLDPRDGIPPIDDPVFEPAAAASEWLEDRVPGVLVQVGGETRFYPLGILHRHEIVNDQIGGIPVAVTYCPLCNTALAFDRRVDGHVLRLGVSGLLRNSDLVMWDDRTVSLWQQVTGEAVVGAAAGTVLAPLPTAIVSFGDFAASYPEGPVLTGGRERSGAYDSNPYVGYSTRSAPGGFYTGEIDPRYPALERVVGVTEGGGAAAYPFPVISELGAVNDSVGGVPVVVLWGGDTADALDTRAVSEGRPVGTGVAYLRTVDGRELTFTKERGVFRDEETSSTWTLLGEAVSGPLAGTRLRFAVHRNEFWFVWGAFFPEGRVYEG